MHADFVTFASKVYIRLWRCWTISILDSNIWSLWSLLQQQALPQLLLYHDCGDVARTMCAAGRLLC